MTDAIDLINNADDLAPCPATRGEATAYQVQKDAAAEESFPVDSEVTVTVTGRVVAGAHPGVVVEFLNGRGFPDRLVAHTDAPGVSVVVAEPASPEEVERRREAYRTMANGFVMDPEERHRILIEAPYGGIRDEWAERAEAVGLSGSALETLIEVREAFARIADRSEDGSGGYACTSGQDATEGASA